MTRFGVMAHLKVLEEAGLILFRRQGRQRYNHLNPVPLRQIYHRWMKPLAELPADELIGLKRHTEEGR
jgi:DNA-binding transcriptional ArsR family regulator